MHAVHLGKGSGVGRTAGGKGVGHGFGAGIVLGLQIQGAVHDGQGRLILELRARQEFFAREVAVGKQLGDAPLQALLLLLGRFPWAGLRRLPSSSMACNWCSGAVA